MRRIRGRTPASVQAVVLQQQEIIEQLVKRVEELEAKLGQNSLNSNRPPSSDSPFKKESSGKVEKKSKAKSRKRRKGYRQQMLDPTETRNIHPKPCSCGCEQFDEFKPYYTHQHVELLEIVNKVIHFVLYSGRCSKCGKVNKGHVPIEFQTGYGPRLSALLVELVGIAGNSRDMVQRFCSSVLHIPISLGAIQKVIDRASKAIEHIMRPSKTRPGASRINHIDRRPGTRVVSSIGCG